MSVSMNNGFFANASKLWTASEIRFCNFEGKFMQR